jgi:hypothetical protein
MHRITDNRMGGVSRRNFRVFRELCGKSTLVNVVIATNMWNDPPTEPELNREHELKTSKMFFEPAVSKGARMTRYVRERGEESAHDIIRMFMPNKPEPLQVQIEVDAGLSLGETSAGQVLTEELNKLIKKQQKEINDLRKEMGDAMKKRDDEAREELTEATRQSAANLGRLEAQLEALKKDMVLESENHQAELSKLRGELEQLTAEAGELRDALARAKSEPEKKALGQKLNNVEKERSSIVLRTWRWITGFFW